VKGFIFKTLLAVSCITVGVHAQERIITAGSAITETVCALGDCNKIIASDRTSLYPPQIQQLPSIGYRTGINAEGIISLGPTLVIAEKEYVDEAVLTQLSESKIKLLVVDREHTVEGTKKLIEAIGNVLGKQTEAKGLIDGLERSLIHTKSSLVKTVRTPRVLCVYNRGSNTVSMAGDNTFAEILRYVGAENAVSVEGYKPLNTEALIAANPDYLIFLSTGYESVGGMEGVLKIPGVLQTTAGKKRQIVSLESLMLTNFGPRLGAAIKELVTMLHPELAAK
jgi:iron complex transport system substrate-binding protein